MRSGLKYRGSDKKVGSRSWQSQFTVAVSVCRKEKYKSLQFSFFSNERAKSISPGQRPGIKLICGKIEQVNFESPAQKN